MERAAIECSKGTITLRKDGIIHLVWDPHLRIEAADARAAMAAVNALADGREHPLLVDMTMTASLSRQAQMVFSQRCATRMALLGTSPVDRILANWVLSAQEQPCPKRFFNSANEAMKWLLLADKSVGS
ncbi:STAS/SEC14 domain-containing protein [Arthrobacter sedimenti]|uniref:STAS/SEC14 domain-containing protein n=1 Tax=Arthrobacter sedimenti TaxID=2694931 RepID=A0ABV8WQG6_9MICC